MTYEQALITTFRDELELSPSAIDWLLGVWNLIQVLDDIADDDEIDRADLDRAIWDCLAGLPSNAFYQRNMTWLVPACAQMVLKWMASDQQEREGGANAQSYMWRAGYYDLVLVVVALEHGPSTEKSLKALRMYGETVEEYLKEFGNA